MFLCIVFVLLVLFVCVLFCFCVAVLRSFVFVFAVFVLQCCLAYLVRVFLFLKTPNSSILLFSILWFSWPFMVGVGGVVLSSILLGGGLRVCVGIELLVFRP